MNLLNVFPSDSLRKETEHYITKKCPRLLGNDKEWYDYLADKLWGLAIVIVVYLLLYSISLFYTFPEFINFVFLEKKDAIDLNTTSNGTLATIVGITMIIIGFIFTEIKSRAFISFDFFSKKTYIFPILYSALANIVAMLIISLFSNTIKNELSFLNSVILSHYLIIFNIGLIVYIFIRVTTFMDYRPVFESYQKMILKKASRILYQEKLEELFSKRVNKVFNDNGINKPYVYGSYNSKQKGVLISENPNGVIHDVAIKKMESEIKNIRDEYPKLTFLYNPFFIGKNIAKNNSIIYTDESNSLVAKNIKLFTIKSANKNEETYQSYFDNIHQQYIDAVRNNNTNLAIDYLSIYQELNKLYCETNQDLR